MASTTIAALRLTAAVAVAVAPAGSTSSAEIVRQVGQLSVRVDTSQAYPGGVVVVRATSRRRLGALWALLDGRRAPFFASSGPARALLAVALGSEPGPATLGVGIAARRGEQRIAIPIEIAARRYPTREAALPPGAPALLGGADPGRDGRRLLAFLRTESREPAPSGLQPPVAGFGAGFGELRRYGGPTNVESLSDALAGEQHRGLEYALPARSPVRSPAAGTVVFAGALALPGLSVVIDHGQGIVSVLQHLSRLDVRAGERVAAGAFVGLSGMSGLVSAPQLEWRVYLHGVAVDPRVLAGLLRSG